MDRYIGRNAAEDSLITPQRAALPTALIALILPIVIGKGNTLPLQELLIYSTCAVMYFAVLLATLWPGLLRPIPVGDCNSRYLIITGLLATVMTYLSGDGLIQPILFTIPFITAIESCGTRRGIIIGSGYLLLMASALGFENSQDLLGLVYPLAGYASLMLFMLAFVNLAGAEREARGRADHLAEENARLARAAALSATLAERNRIARELHDTIAQGLAATTLQLEAAQQLFPRDPQLALQQLDRGLNHARQTLRDVRHSVWTLAAPTTAPNDLPQALNELTDQLAMRTTLAVTYQHSGTVPLLDRATATQLLRIVQEALQNTEQHAAARSCRVLSSCQNDILQFQITDDGRGFAGVNNDNARGRGFGLISMRERAQLLGASLQIISTPGSGTVVTLELSLSNL